MDHNYFYWEGHPILVELGSIELPFPLNILGLLLGIIAYFWIANTFFTEGQSEKNAKKRKRKKREKAEEQTSQLTGWQAFGLFTGCIVAGQILFLVLPGPSFEQIGPITLRWYGLLFATAFLSGYFITRKLFRDAGRPIEQVDLLLTYVLIATIVGARLGHVFFYEAEYYLRNPVEILYIWRGGLASHGATIGILIGLYLYIRRIGDMSFFWLTDRVALPVIFGGTFIRIGNFFNSEIYGIETSVPWAVIFASVDEVPRHPSMLYEAIFALLIFTVLVLIYRHYKSNPPIGLITGWFMILLFSSRILVEFTKVDPARFAHDWMLAMGQLLSIPFVLFGIWILWKQVPKWRRNPSKS